jgi:hypothetical protein
MRRRRISSGSCCEPCRPARDALDFARQILPSRAAIPSAGSPEPAEMPEMSLARALLLPFRTIAKPAGSANSAMSPIHDERNQAVGRQHGQLDMPATNVKAAS